MERKMKPKSRTGSGRGVKAKKVLAYLTENQNKDGVAVWMSEEVISRGLEQEGVLLTGDQVKDVLKKLKKKGQVVRISLSDGRTTWSPSLMDGSKDNLSGEWNMEDKMKYSSESDVWVDPERVWSTYSRAWHDGHLEAWNSGWGLEILRYRVQILELISAPEHPLSVLPLSVRLSVAVWIFLQLCPATPVEVKKPKNYLLACMAKMQERDPKSPEWYLKDKEQVEAKGQRVADGILSGGWVKGNRSVLNRPHLKVKPEEVLPKPQNEGVRIGLWEVDQVEKLTKSAPYLLESDLNPPKVEIERTPEQKEQDRCARLQALSDEDDPWGVQGHHPAGRSDERGLSDGDEGDPEGDRELPDGWEPEVISLGDPQYTNEGLAGSLVKFGKKGGRSR